MAQGDRSLVDLTTMDLKNSMASARKRWPRMVAQLEQELGSFVKTDPGFAALEAMDVERGITAEAAKRDYDLMLEKAKQYDIDTTINPPGGKNFARIYLRRAGWNFQKTESEQYTDAIRAVSNRRMHDVAEEIRESVEGNRQTAYDVIRGVRQTMLERSKFITTGASDDFNVSIDWDTVGKPKALDDVDMAIITLADTINAEYSFIDRDSDVLISAQKVIDNGVKHLNVLRKAIEDDNVTHLAMWEAKQKGREAALREKLPRLAQFDDMVGSFEHVFEPKFFEKMFNKEHTVVQDLFSTVLVTDAGEWMSQIWLKGGQGSPVGNKSAMTVRQELRSALNMDTDGYGYPTDNNDFKEQSEAAVTWMAGTFDNLHLITDTSTSQGALPALQSITTVADHLATFGYDTFDGPDKGIMAGIGSKRFHKLVDLVDDDPSLWPASFAAGDALNDWYVNAEGGHKGRRNKLMSVVSVGLPGDASAHQLIKIDGEGPDENGELLYVVDNKLVDIYLANTPEVTLANLGVEALFRATGLMPKTRKEALVAKLTPLAVELSVQTNANFQAQAAIWKLQHPNQTMGQREYQALFNENSYEVLAQMDTSEGEAGE